MQAVHSLMSFTPRVMASAAVAVFFSAGVLEAANYQDQVNEFEPTFYFELNETDLNNGVLDSVSGTAIGSYNVDGTFDRTFAGPDTLIDGGRWTDAATAWDTIGADVPIVGLGAGNMAFDAADDGHIDLLGNNDTDRGMFGANAMTVALFAQSGGPAQGGERVFTNNIADGTTSFQIVVGNDGIVVSVDPSSNSAHGSLFFPGEVNEGTSTGADRGMTSPDNLWWHVVASTSGTTAQERTDNIRLMLNGVDRTADLGVGTTGWGRNEFPAKIGGRRGDPLDSTTYSGQIDEVSIFLDQVLTDAEARALYDAATDPDHVLFTRAAGFAGDFDDSGAVGNDDLTLLLDGWGGAPGAGWTNNPPETVGNDSLTLLLDDWGQPITPALGAASVPEPTSMAIAFLAAISGLAMRRRA